MSLVYPGTMKRLPESHSFILTPCRKMPAFMRIPTQAKTLSRMAVKLHLWVHNARGHTRMLRSIPNHHAPIGAHGSNNVGVLWLVSSFVHFSLMIDLLHNVEFHLHDRRFLRSSTSVASNFLAFFIVVCGVRCNWFWQLYMSDLKVVGSLIRGMGSDQESMGGEVFIRSAA